MGGGSGETGERDARRRALAGEIAAVVLRHGLGELAGGLRGLAKRLNSSDRMLLYYFGTKEALVEAALEQVGERLAAILARRGSGERVTPGVFLGRVLALAGEPEVAPFMRAWAEVIARGGRGEEPYGRFAERIVRESIAWIDGQLVPAEGERGRGRAAAILSVVEGTVLLEMAAPGVVGGAAGDWLARALEAEGRQREPAVPAGGGTGKRRRR